MKAITANSIATGLEADSNTLIITNSTTKEVILMNLISSIMIKDKDIKKAAVDSKRIKVDQDHGFNIYKALEFGRDSASKTSHNLQMEAISSRLV